MPSEEALLQDLGEPARLWRAFVQLSAIPRPSGREDRVLSWLKSFAAEHGLSTRSDAVGNLVITRPGSGGGESAPTVIIQGHVDMVTEKNADVSHDFLTDPLSLKIEDGWLTAEGTTLGADNGIGVAAAMAVLQMPSTVKLPPIEALFTVDEETGLTGAFQLDGGMLEGRVMLNLDTEEWGELFIGCAGGGDSKISLRVGREDAPSGLEALEVRVDGLLGGHSGLNIGEGRGNAAQLLTGVCRRVRAAHPTARLVDLAGGDKRNAIAREAWAHLAVPPEEVAAVRDTVAAAAAELQAEYGGLETGLRVAVLQEAVAAAPGTVMTQPGATALLRLVNTLPHGAVKYSHAVEGLVETSSNVASVRADPGDPATYRVVTSTRSSLSGAMEVVRDRIQDIAELCGADVVREDAYPGWAPNPRSDVLQVCKGVFEELLGAPPAVKAIHAGLECGILKEKLPGLDCVSYGPTITGAHSPDEACEISTVEPFWRVTLRVLERLADVRA